MPRTTRYRIADRTEEGECRHCGCALYVGDYAHMTEAEHVYCSAKCAAYEASDLEHERN
ncbi:MAG TPA: hypothetical protein VM529_24875 [Gemmata sp.]|jgi:hypothetical protein|nr:hypothetical protein [Gemmata sp.]